MRKLQEDIKKCLLKRCNSKESSEINNIYRSDNILKPKVRVQLKNEKKKF